MDQINTQIKDHYNRNGLFEIIIERLKEQGLALEGLKRHDISGVDEFHVRGAAVSEELARQVSIRGAKVLDVGCGIGGPARMLADEYNCQVTGIDLSAEFIRTAQLLSELTNFSEHTTFLQADATQLPFEDASFDVVWTQHVQMNIPDKAAFYGEITRVLKPNGLFLNYEILKNGTGQIDFPVPWANSPEISFLEEAQVMEQRLKSLGFETTHKKDQTAEGIQFFEKLLQKIKTSGPPAVGLNLLMGEQTLVKLSNLLNGLKASQLFLQSGVFRKF